MLSETKDMQHQFLEQLSKRLNRGREEYGDASFFEANAPEEILEEILDVAGWAYVLWVQARMRLQALELAVEKVEKDQPQNRTPR